MSLSAIIVNYNSFTDCCSCVESLLRHRIVEPRRIILVDNCSPDGSGRQLEQAFPAITVILAPANGGFAAGVNMGFARARESAYCMILNPDVQFTENDLARAVAEFERDERLGVLGLNLVNPDRSPQYSARRFYSLLTLAIRRTPLGRLAALQKLQSEHLMRDAWKGAAFDCDWVLGAGMIVRSEAFEQIGGMDDGYFLYLEDTDMCKRMWQAGWSVRAIPAVRLVHAHARASHRTISRANLHHLRSLSRYWRKFGLPLTAHGRRA